MGVFVKAVKAVAEENRLRALMALRGGELCVCQITELLALAPSTVSRHMSILNRAGLVQSRKEGRWVNYSLIGLEAESEAAKTLSWVIDTLSETEQIKADEIRLREILKIDREVLCKKQSPCHAKGSGYYSFAPLIPAGPRWPRD